MKKSDVEFVNAQTYSAITITQICLQYNFVFLKFRYFWTMKFFLEEFWSFNILIFMLLFMIVLFERTVSNILDLREIKYLIVSHFNCNLS